ncbi:hypothetical protein FQA39_LY15302 [Lamprigera yunnana]|nr:hypothetical protein FQA39_LY15302 [Lamprigera yunnana]
MSEEEYNHSYYYNKQEQAEDCKEVTTTQSWSEWNADQRYLQNYNRLNEQQNYKNNQHGTNYNYHPNTGGNHGNPSNRGMHLNHGHRFNQYNNSNHNPNQRPFYQNRFQNRGHQYGSNPMYGWHRNQSYKRPRPDLSENEHMLKTSKKKKKSLSQNVPTKKEWSIQEAEDALATEKAFNKKTKNALIIKFPDHELNKDIVSHFHPAIENVHFQQPCTPRFCFVTLQESADPDEVIGFLNSQKFGDGFLTVEYKKDRDEDQVVLADDIDPLTLYVGNLAQEVTKEDIVNLYPNNKRIDIGFAKKMKFTRYAFIAFRTASESLAAFKKTHSKQMYSKSLIVRFRRLHGTIGMPGEAKPQNPPRNRDDAVAAITIPPAPETPVSSITSMSISTNRSTTNCSSLTFLSDSNTRDTLDESSSLGDNESLREQKPSTSLNIKTERRSPSYNDEYVTEYNWNQMDVKNEPTVNIKKEPVRTNNDKFVLPKEVKDEAVIPAVEVKREPAEDSDDDLDISNLYTENNNKKKIVVEEEEEDDPDEEDIFADILDFDRIYENMMNHKHKLSLLKQSSMK